MTAVVKRVKQEPRVVYPSIVEVPADRETKIAEQAYYKAEQRGFEPGHEMDDWLEAERELFN